MLTKITKICYFSQSFKEPVSSSVKRGPDGMSRTAEEPGFCMYEAIGSILSITKTGNKTEKKFSFAYSILKQLEFQPR